VATLAAGADTLPIRLISTLTPGRAGKPSLDLEVARSGVALLVSDLAPADAVGSTEAGAAWAAVSD
jgi:hypothetical protein